MSPANDAGIMDRFRLEGKTALVTGASRGIGLAIARGLSDAGATVVLAGRQLATLEPVAAELQSLGRTAFPVQMDVSRIEELEDVVGSVAALAGGVDILVNNAGINVRRESLEFRPDDWDRILDTNLRGAFFLTQAVGKRMVDQARGGKILNITSMSAYLGLATVSAYTASKSALQQLTRLLAVEWAEHGIQVNAIAPGWIHTEMTSSLKDTPRYQWVLNRTPAGRFGEPDELAGAAVFLCSPAANFITGHVLAVDGGILAGSDWRSGT